MSILSKIKPEHIAEMRFHDCGDLSLQRPNSDRALFIVLKEGIGYDRQKGPYVAPEPALLTASRVRADSAGVPNADSLPRHRFRLLGVFDEETGFPVAAADVVDVRTGWKVATSATGAASLFFLPEAGGTIRVVKAGYVAQELPVAISPADTLPITLLLARVK